ncbi:hypothetical protein FRC04_008521, partial [Tulasnella sp. 424]
MGGGSGGDSVVKHIISQRISPRLVGSQSPTFLTLLAPGPRPRILLRKLDVNVILRGGSGTYSRNLADGLGLPSWSLVTAVVTKYADNIIKWLRD